ncbi:hypothetical protein OIU79_024975 [Salix purpurea]|uniref:DUF4283 domain-containing protein n=1 Tax=Salix purpurea TaxID=77065 RepID=A0A9Q1A6U5_SALPP|nr:hypothetical protein OIU79_024975 [Salix purpurea]
MDPHKKPNRHQPATKPPKQPVASWADRVKVTDSNTRFTLDSIPQQEMGSNIEITEDMLAEHAEKWNRSLVGFFPGYRMNFFTVNKIASRVWKPLGLEAVTTTASGFIIFQFQKEDQMHEILERGPWLFGDSEKAVTPAEENNHIATRQCPLNENHEGTSGVQKEVQHGSDPACTVGAITKTKESNAMVKTTVARGKEVTSTTGIQHEPAVKKNTKGQGPVVREKGVMEVPVKHKEQEGNGEKQPKGVTSSQVEKPVRCTDNEMACLKSQSSIADEESSVGWETSSLAFIKVKNKKSAKKKGKEARCL